MPKYNLLITIIGTPREPMQGLIYTNQTQILSKEVTYDVEYLLNADIVNIGSKGYISKIGETTEYYPPHRIYKIDVEEIKP